MSPVRYTKLLMVEPAAFGFNAQTAATNRFQQHAIGSENPATEARAQFNALVAALRGAGVEVCVAHDAPAPIKPDAVFPNNWVSFHDDGTVVLYPMHSENRRAERSEPILEQVQRELGFVEKRRIDLTAHEHKGCFLEGTGSLVLDAKARVAYACRSPRTDETLVREWAQLMDYEPVLFDAIGPDGTPVYHTNVVLWIGERLAGIGLDWIAADQRAMLVDQLRLGNSRDLLPLDTTALQAFAGNMIEITARDGVRRLVMSTAAEAALSDTQHAQILEAGCRPLVIAIPVIEKLGGGSVRCMVAEVPFAS